MIWIVLFIAWSFFGGFALGAYCWPHILRWTRKTFDSFRPPAEVIYRERQRPWTLAEKRKEVRAMKRDLKALMKSLPDAEAEAVLSEVLPKLARQLDELIRGEQ